jgi:cysteine desulfurase/selenocysteine lyase
MKSIEELRRETPGVEIVVHFSNCGAALQPAAVVDAQIEHLWLERDLGGYEAAEHNRDRRTFYTAAAELLGCDPSEIAFTDSASRAWNVFLHSLSLRPGDEILTSRIEFGNGLRALHQLAARSGATLKIVGSQPDGTIDLDDLATSLNDRVKLVAITHAAGHYGGVNPAEEIGKLVSNTGALYLIDACQSVGQMPIDVDTILCDVLTASGRKWLRGPRGTGFLYVRNGVTDRVDPATMRGVPPDSRYEDYSAETGLEEPAGARRFERWERNVAAEIGLAVAIEYLLDIGIDAVQQNIRRLTAQVEGRLRGMPKLSLLDTEDVRSGLIGMTLSGGAAAIQAMRGYLRERGVNVSSMAFEDAPVDCELRRIESTLRVAPHYYNTVDEIDILCEHLAAGLRALS